MAEPGSLARGWQRAMGRIRHGLLVQEILDRLTRFGVVVLPYLVTAEASTADNRPAETPHEVRWMTPADAPEIARISVRKQPLQMIIERFGGARCLGIFCDGRLAGYTWVTIRTARIPASGGVTLLEMASDEAYLFDMFINPEFRGARLAPLLRAHLLETLLREGRANCYSLTMAFNRSSRRFKARLGAQVLELRVYLHLRLGQLRGVDIRLWRWGPHARTPLWLQVPLRSGTADAD